MKKALIIFVRHPELGKVKTRLAAGIGNEAALCIYKKLLEHTLTITKTIEADKFVYYADHIVNDDMWQHEHYYKLLQENADLGKRIQTAFQTVFDRGYKRVCIIGSDCYELSTEIIDDAFTALDQNDVVVGPAKDGGYYLLGIKELHHQLFENKNWSTETVFAETIQTINELNLSFTTLPVLKDVDVVEDVPEEWLVK